MSEESRPPTSHERSSGQNWDASYQDGPAPWDIGRAQSAVVREGAFRGAVLDAGCGTGDNTLQIASLGVPVLGFDVAATAIDMARDAATRQGSTAEFVVADAFRLENLGRTFDTVLDSGLFHTFDTAEQRSYATSLATVTAPGATVYLLCFADVGSDLGPHPISRDDLNADFDASNGWNVRTIEPGRIETRYHDNGAPGWFATIDRI